MFYSPPNGYIRYSVKGLIKRPGLSMDIRSKAVLTVLRKLDLNRITAATVSTVFVGTVAACNVLWYWIVPPKYKRYDWLSTRRQSCWGSISGRAISRTWKEVLASATYSKGVQLLLDETDVNWFCNVFVCAAKNSSGVVLWLRVGWWESATVENMAVF